MPTLDDAKSVLLDLAKDAILEDDDRDSIHTVLAALADAQASADALDHNRCELAKEHLAVLAERDALQDTIHVMQEQMQANVMQAADEYRALGEECDRRAERCRKLEADAAALRGMLSHAADFLAECDPVMFDGWDGLYASVRAALARPAGAALRRTAVCPDCGRESKPFAWNVSDDIARLVAEEKPRCPWCERLRALEEVAEAARTCIAPLPSPASPASPASHCTAPERFQALGDALARLDALKTPAEGG